MVLMLRTKGFYILCLLGLSSGAMAISPIEKSGPYSVLQKLQQEIAAEPLSNQTPIDTVMARYADKAGIDFQMDWKESENGEVKKLSKPANVSSEDWQAFLIYWKATGSGVDIMSENQSASFTLADLDGDGKNDLILDYYVGGTGLFSYIEIGKRDAKNGFVFEASSENGMPTGYSINGRGGDQAIHYLRIDGKYYMAYRNGVYGRDVLTVKPAISDSKISAEQKAIFVQYRYKHTAMKPKTPTVEVSAALLTAANKQLQKLKFDQAGKQLDPNSLERCPIPKPRSDDEDASYWPWHSAGHYTFDYVADFRIKIKQGCYSASIIVYKSSYQTSYEQCCKLQVLDGPSNDYVEIALKTQRERSSVSIEASLPAG